MKRLGTMLVALLAATATWADFGDYESHTADGDSLKVITTVGELSITAVDDAAFEVLEATADPVRWRQHPRHLEQRSLAADLGACLA